MKIEYPKALYHAIEETRIVHSREEHEALGSGWHEAPLPSAADLDAVVSDPPSHPELQPSTKFLSGKRRK